MHTHFWSPRLKRSKNRSSDRVIIYTAQAHRYNKSLWGIITTKVNVRRFGEDDFRSTSSIWAILVIEDKEKGTQNPERRHGQRHRLPDGALNFSGQKWSAALVLFFARLC